MFDGIKDMLVTMVRNSPELQNALLAVDSGIKKIDAFEVTLERIEAKLNLILQQQEAQHVGPQFIDGTAAEQPNAANARSVACGVG